MKPSTHCNADAKRGKAAGHLRIIKAAQRFQRVERLRRQYDRHLDQVAGLTEATRSAYWLFIGQFLQQRFGRRPLRLGALRAEDVNGFIRHSGSRLQRSSLHVLAAALRSFLSFLHFTGRTPVALASAVVCPAPRSRSPIPDTFSEPELRRFLKGFDRTQAIGKRNFARKIEDRKMGLPSIFLSSKGQPHHRGGAGAPGLAGVRVGHSPAQRPRQAGQRCPAAERNDPADQVDCGAGADRHGQMGPSPCSLIWLRAKTNAKPREPSSHAPSSNSNVRF